jgi:hypothetical protein
MHIPKLSLAAFAAIALSVLAFPAQGSSKWNFVVK